MGSSIADVRLRQIEEEIAAAKLQSEHFFDKVSELDDAIREIEIRAADKIRALESESNLNLKKSIEFENIIEALRSEACVLKSQ